MSEEKDEVIGLERRRHELGARAKGQPGDPPPKQSVMDERVKGARAKGQPGGPPPEQNVTDERVKGVRVKGQPDDPPPKQKE